MTRAVPPPPPLTLHLHLHLPSPSPIDASAAPPPCCRPPSIVHRPWPTLAQATPAAAAAAEESSEEEDTEESSIGSEEEEEEREPPVAGEFDDGTQWGKYNTMYDDDVDLGAMELADVDGPSTDVVMSCRMSDAHILQITEYFRSIKVGVGMGMGVGVICVQQRLMGSACALYWFDLCVCGGGGTKAQDCKAPLPSFLTLPPVFATPMQPRIGYRGVGVHDIIGSIGWRTPLGPLRQELYQLVRVSDSTMFKFKVRSPPSAVAWSGICTHGCR
jgi:hypothetical protein